MIKYSHITDCGENTDEERTKRIDRMRANREQERSRRSNPLPLNISMLGRIGRIIVHRLTI